ncbi:hydroxysqualene dehydroxylase HpnE [Dactylosporangium sp. CA-139066]|uniref:hydroxysqualene dehydroxylase HpnE n=1 Tax=Dactylosporangium sp. CA-139066 TaxID=3239930 RepID=UPI003D94B9DA
MSGASAGRGGPEPVCVIGGGLAGIAAAVRIARAGRPVTLLERRSRLGGATYTFQRRGVPVDTGQHVFLRCYTEYRELLRTIGGEPHVELQRRFTVPVLAPGGRQYGLRRYALPAPAHLVPALLRYGLLSRPERWAAIRAAAALRGVAVEDPAADEVTFGQWLAEHGQGPGAVRRLWDVVTLAALNVPSAEASLALAAHVFRTGLLDAADAADIGRLTAPLATVHAETALHLLRRIGARVRCGAAVRRIERDGAGYTVAAGGGEVRTPAVVLAVPHPAASRLVPAGAVPDPRRWLELGTSPIVNVHLHYAAPVTALPFAAAVDSPVQWLFRLPAAAGDAGQRLVLSLSGAGALIDVPASDLIDRYRDAVAELLPRARATELLDAFVTREPHATIRQSPGVQALRPPAATRFPGLVLAGAWTATGWPDTMEGAVRSGNAAADIVLRHLASASASES